MLAELLEVVKILSEVSDRSQQAGEANRQRIAKYLLDIEKCLRESVQELQQGRAPNSQWSELKSYAQHLPTTIRQDIGQLTADQLSSLLLSIATNIPTNNDISSIENAAGTFRGLANTITAKGLANTITATTNTKNPSGNQFTGTTRRNVLTYLKYTGLTATGLVGGLILHNPISNISNVLAKRSNLPT